MSKSLYLRKLYLLQIFSVWVAARLWCRPQAQKSGKTLHHGLRNTSFKLSQQLGYTEDIVPSDHPTPQSHLSPVTSRPDNLSSLRYGPSICCEHVTARESVVIAFRPENHLFLCRLWSVFPWFTTWQVGTSKFRSRASDVLKYIFKTASLTNTSLVMYITRLYI